MMFIASERIVHRRSANAAEKDTFAEQWSTNGLAWSHAVLVDSTAST
jgi:hypothetical protein